MLENCNGNGRVVECTECYPPRRFKNKAGLNGHIQFKHGRLPDGRDVVPNGKQSQMYQDLTDRVNQVIDRQDGMFDHVKNGANGNENEEVGDLPTSEGNDYSSELIGISAPLRLIRQLIPIKIVELHLPGCSGTAAVVAKRSTGMVFLRNCHRRPQAYLMLS
jgi:hypothetical protein